jgi:hypothetical protein
MNSLVTSANTLVSNIILSNRGGSSDYYSERAAPAALESCLRSLTVKDRESSLSDIIPEASKSSYNLKKVWWNLLLRS